MASNPQKPRRMLLPPIGTFSPGENTEHDEDEDCADAGCTPVDRAASPLPAEPTSTLGEILESASKEVATWEPWQRSLDPFGPATPSAAEPQKEE